MPYIDPRDHHWATPEPSDEDRCIRCGTPWPESAEWQCGGPSGRERIPSLIARAAIPAGGFQKLPRFEPNGIAPRTSAEQYFEQRAQDPGYASELAHARTHVDEVVTEVKMSDVIDLTRTNERWARIEAVIREMFEEDLVVLKDRAYEYGSDLDIQGRSMETLLPGRHQMSREQARVAGIEMAIASYLMGKSARLYGSWEHGMFPRPDNYRDLSTFGFMARVVRKLGEWL